MPEHGFIIIVSRNNMTLTRLAVNSALAQDMPCSVYLIDNASVDNSIRYACAKAGIMFTGNSIQRSLAACWNHGLKTAWLNGQRHALVLNNDVEIRPDTYRLLLAHGGPFVTCVSVDSPTRLNYPEPPTSERPHPDFSCFLIRKSVTETVGWFDEEMFPAYAEDCDMHVRMHRAGVKAVSIDLPFLHHGASTIKHATAADRHMIERGAERNRERFRQKYGCLPGSEEYSGLFI